MKFKKKIWYERHGSKKNRRTYFYLNKIYKHSFFDIILYYLKYGEYEEMPSAIYDRSYINHGKILYRRTWQKILKGLWGEDLFY